MPLYTQNNLPEGPLTIDDYEPFFAAYMRAAWGDADNDNPGTVTGNMLEASERRYGFNVMDVAEAGGLTGGLEELAQAEPLPAWSQEEQKAYIRDEGLEGVLSPGEHYTRPELEFLAKLRHEEIERKLTREKASAWYAPFGFLAGLGASFTDPVNLATSLVPVLPEARMMQLLAKSGSAWGRAGIRAGVGAAEGAVGAAVVEPMIIGGKTELQQEYGLADSLMNVVFGAAMGAVMKPAAGALGDWMRQKKGQRQPWEYVPSSDLTERLRNENAARIWAGMRESGAEKLAPEHAEAAAALWDATLRGYAYDTGELVGDVYARYRTEWRGGRMEIVDMRGDALEQAMYRSPLSNIPDFLQDVRENPSKKPRFLSIGETEIEGVRYSVDIPSNAVTHIDQHHPGYDGWEEIFDVISTGERIPIAPLNSTGFQGTAFYKTDGTLTHIVLATVKSGRKGNIVSLHTALKENPKKAQKWLEQNKRPVTASQSAGGSPAHPSPQGDVLSVPHNNGNGESLQQTFPDGNPRARVTFGEADAYAVVEFFKSADPSTAPHEMYHIFRRIMADMYDDPNASEASRERYRKACEFVGAEPGRGWTREQEEMFARAGERFLLEGVTPNPRMGDVMESFRQWMEEVYGNAERSGLEISDGMRALFGGMMGTAEDGDISFRYAMGKLLDYSPEKAIDTRVELPAEHTADGAPEQMLEAYARDSAARLEEAYSALADRPEAQERFRADLEAEMAEADAAVIESQRRGEIMRAAAACIMRS